MEAGSQIAGAPPEAGRRTVAEALGKGDKVECLFTDGSSVLLSNFLASFIRRGDEVRFPLTLGKASAGAELHICSANSQQRRADVYQASIGYATQPKRDKRGNLFVSARVLSQHLGISSIHIRCETLRDYFYATNRRRTWNQQATFYELLRTCPTA
ncbi:MAG: hypothetical protein L0338_34690, partial [Acidobacteria bacterium]|nr:hypothetical protein [Acidobacteriota bacterium]